MTNQIFNERKHFSGLSKSLRYNFFLAQRILQNKTEIEILRENQKKKIMIFEEENNQIKIKNIL